VAAPQNAAQVSSAQEAAQGAQQAAQSSFAAQVHKREETVTQTDHAEGTKVRTNPDGGDGRGYTPQRRRRHAPQADETPDEPAVGFSGGDEHLIDFTA